MLHSLPTLVRQRIFQIACGYADQNDATTLRSDPLLKAVCGRLPESGADLTSQPTLSRLENAVDRHACEAMAEALVAVYIRERQQTCALSTWVLDIDGTDDPICVKRAENGRSLRRGVDTQNGSTAYRPKRSKPYNGFGGWRTGRFGEPNGQNRQSVQARG